MTEFFSPSELFLEEPWQDLTPISQLEGKEGKPGPQGVAGNSFRADKQGLASGKSVYDNAPLPFSYLAEDTGLLYFRTAPTGWTQGFPFSKGDKGDNGKPVEFNHSATHLQWRYVGDTVWINLIDLNSIRGKDGDPATNLIKSVNGLTGDVVLDAKSVGAVKEAYSTPPYIDLDFNSPDCILPEWFTRLSTATYFDEYGVMRTAAIGEPRIDFDPATKELKGLLLEKTSTNLMLHSGNQMDGSFVTTGSTKTASAIPGLDGTGFFTKVTETTASEAHRVNGYFGGQPEDTVVWCSAFVIAGERKRVLVAHYNFAAWKVRTTLVLDTATGETFVTTGGEGFARNCGNGVWRVFIKGVVGNSGGTLAFGVGTRPDDASTGSAVTGDGTSGIYTWGWQVEAVNYPSSYIPTTTAAATRAAENFVINTGSVSLTKRRSLSIEYENPSLVSSSYEYVVGISDGSVNNYIAIARTVNFEGARMSSSNVASNLRPETVAAQRNTLSWDTSVNFSAQGVVSTGNYTVDGIINTIRLGSLTAGMIFRPAVLWVRSLSLYLGAFPVDKI